MSYQQRRSINAAEFQKMWAQVNGHQQARNPFANAFTGSFGNAAAYQNAWKPPQGNGELIQMTKSPDGVYRRA